MHKSLYAWMFFCYAWLNVEILAVSPEQSLASHVFRRRTFFNDHLCVFFMCTGLKYQCCMYVCNDTSIQGLKKRDIVEHLERLAICQNLISSKYFHKMDPLFHMLLTSFAFFVTNLRKSQNLLFLAIFFCHFRIFSQAIFGKC